MAELVVDFCPKMFVHNSDRISLDFHNKVAVVPSFLTSVIWLA